MTHQIGSHVLRWLPILALLLAFLPVVNQPPSALTPGGLHPMPPHPKLLEKLRQEGRPLPEMLKTKRAQGIDQPYGFPNPPSGNFNLLAVCVQFSDKPSSVVATSFDGLIFNPPGSGSVRDYYNEISYGSLTLVTVNMPGATGWVTATRPYNSATGYVNADGVAGTTDDYGWGAYPQNLQGIVADVIPLIDPVMNFANYDNDNDGFVDSVVFVHAGPGAEITGSPNDVWSCAWNMSVGNGPGPLATSDGVSVDNFTFDPEYMFAPGDQTIGVYCHELGHTLFGLPDLYDLDNTSYGLGYWSLMAYGGWNGSLGLGSSPAWPDAWCRTVMGFEPTLPTDGDMPGFLFPPVWTGPALTVRLQSPQLGPKEYFLVENRQQVGFDTWLPGNGLLIWHVDEDKWNPWEYNRYECTVSPGCQCPVWHYLVALEQADGLLDLENKTNVGDAGDPFPGASGNTTFQFNTNPDSASWFASPCPTNSCITVTNIAVLPGPPPFHLVADLHVVCQSAGACVNVLPANQVGWGQPGVTVTYRASVQNCSTISDTFDVAVSGSWPGIVYDLSTSQAITQTGNVWPGGAYYVGALITVPVNALPAAFDVTTLAAVSNNDPTISAAGLITTRVPNCVLLVDDDRGTGVESVYMKALTNNNFAFGYWDTSVRGSPGLSTLTAHQAVIWFTGGTPAVPLVDTLSPREEIALATYLDQGGQLFLCSRDYLWDVGRSAFSRDYLRVATYTNDTGTNVVKGVIGDPVGGSCGTYTLNPTAWLSDQINPHPPASGAFVDAGGLTNALTYDSGTWRVLFLAWPFENLAQPDADAVMLSTMNWFGIQPSPVAAFTPSDATVCEGDVVTFTSTSANATSYQWDFGDGATSTLTNPTHAYAAPMTVTVVLTASNACGYGVASQSISVYTAPVAGFTPSTTTVDMGQVVTFTNTSANATSYQWDFGDGIGTSTMINPTYTYTSGGWYTVTLVASNPGCSDSTTRQIQVMHVLYLPLVLKSY